nr:hypothetical protein [Tanacetum cinerariifolium]
MVAILEKTEHNTDFHQIVDFLKAFHCRRYTRRAIQIAQSKALSPAADEPASLLRDDKQGEAFPTISSIDIGQDRENIAKTSTMPCESSSRVLSLGADEGTKLKDQDLEIFSLKARVKSLKDKERRHVEHTQEDAPITGEIINIGEELGVEKSTKLGINDTKEMVNVLSSMGAVNILSSEGAAASVSPADVLPAAGSYKGKEKLIETEVPKKRKLQEQRDAQVAREMEEEFARENQRLSEQLVRDSEIARLHAEEELNIMIEGLDRSNEFEDFVPMSSKEESERVKRQGLKIDQESLKRMKISEGASEEELNGMMQIVPLEEFYIKDLQQFDKEDLHQLWTLVKETFNTKQATKTKRRSCRKGPCGVNGVRGKGVKWFNRVRVLKEVKGFWALFRPGIKDLVF